MQKIHPNVALYLDKVKDLDPTSIDSVRFNSTLIGLLVSYIPTGILLNALKTADEAVKNKGDHGGEASD